MSSERDGTLPLVLRVVPFVAAAAAAVATFLVLRSVWMSAPETAPYVGISAETMRLLLVVTIPISPSLWMILGMLYIGIHANRMSTEGE